MVVEQIKKNGEIFPVIREVNSRPFSSKVVDRSGHRYSYYSFRLFSLSVSFSSCWTRSSERGESIHLRGSTSRAGTGRGNVARRGSARLDSVWPLNDVHRSGCTHSTSGIALFYLASSSPFPFHFAFTFLSPFPFSIFSSPFSTYNFLLLCVSVDSRSLSFLIFIPSLKRFNVRKIFE